MTKDKWITWAVPVEYCPTYIITLFLAMFITPLFVFGITFTTFGWLVNFLWFDFVFYIWYKVRITIQKTKGKDKDEGDRME